MVCLGASFSALPWSNQTATCTQTAQVTLPTTEWNATFGLGYYNTAYQIIQTQDGGYAVAGMYGPQGSRLNSAVAKYDANGNLLWNNSYDMRFFNIPTTGLLQTDDGGYAIVGNRDIDVTLAFIRTDSEGKTLWNQTYPSINCIANGLTQAPDGGYLISGGRGDGKGVFVKIDAIGKMQWSKTYEINGFPRAVQTDDGNYVTLGSGHLIKIDTYGNILWNKSLPAPVLPSDPEYYRYSINYIEEMIKTTDGGYVLLARAVNEDKNGTETRLPLIIKTDSSGTIEWNKTYGESRKIWPTSIVQTVDGGYAFAGTSSSDMILVKTDKNGNMLWNQTFDNNQNDEAAFSVIQTIDGGFALAGKTKNPQNYSSGYFYIVKTTADTSTTITGDNLLLPVAIPGVVLGVLAIVGILLIVLKRKHRTTSKMV
jgi:hypothetical protein